MQGSQAENSALYKTRLCQQFTNNGRCQFGDNCKYAHGQAELRPLTEEGQQILNRLEAKKAQEKQQGGSQQQMNRPQQPPGPPSLGQGMMNPMQQGAGMQGGMMNPMGMGMAPMGMGMTPMQQQQGMMGMNPMAGMQGQGMMGGNPMMPNPMQQQHGGMMQGQGMMGMNQGMGNMRRPNMPMPPTTDISKQQPQQHKPKPPPPQATNVQAKQTGGSTARHQTTTPTAPSPSPTAAAAGLKASQTSIAASPASVPPITDPSVKAEVAYIERVRATCGLLNIGNASVYTTQRPDLVTLTLTAVRNRTAYRPNAYADDVSHYLMSTSTAQAAKS